MPLVVERSFEAACNVMASAVSNRRHRLGRSQVPASGTANKEEVVVHLHAERPQLTSKAFTQNGFDEALCIKHVTLSVGC